MHCNSCCYISGRKENDRERKGKLLALWLLLHLGIEECWFSVLDKCDSIRRAREKSVPGISESIIVVGKKDPASFDHLILPKERRKTSFLGIIFSSASNDFFWPFLVTHKSSFHMNSYSAHLTIAADWDANSRNT